MKAIPADVPTHEDLLDMLARAAPSILVLDGAQLPPPAAREALRRAARTSIVDGCTLARINAIDDAIASVQLIYPLQFRKD